MNLRNTGTFGVQMCDDWKLVCRKMRGTCLDTDGGRLATRKGGRRKTAKNELRLHEKAIEALGKQQTEAEAWIREESSNLRHFSGGTGNNYYQILVW